MSEFAFEKSQKYEISGDKILKNYILLIPKGLIRNHLKDLVTRKLDQEDSPLEIGCCNFWIFYFSGRNGQSKFKNDQNLMFKVPLWAEKSTFQKSLHGISKTSIEHDICPKSALYDLWILLTRLFCNIQFEKMLVGFPIFSWHLTKFVRLPFHNEVGLHDPWLIMIYHLFTTTLP